MASLGPSQQSMRARGGNDPAAHSSPEMPYEKFAGAGAGAGPRSSSLRTVPGYGAYTAYPPPPFSQDASGQIQAGLGKGKGGKVGGPGKGGWAGTGITSGEIRLLFAVVVVALIVRLWKIGQPSSVVFDEVHFGGFASKYIKQRFFMDVHPPLAKMLIALVAWLAGFDGDFDFKDIGREYLVGEHTPVPYVAMRSLCALLGVAVVPLSYLTLRALSLRATTALVGALLVTFENGLIIQSRLILLDSPLLFFTALTVFCWTTFCNEEKRAPFTRRWWAWLAATGLSLGAVASCKWVGLFTIATIGVSVIAQLWTHLGDVRQPVRTLSQHFLARAICLIALPIIVYMTCFAIHLGLLSRSGEGDGFMTSEFQHTLRGHGMRDTYADVSLGSTVSIRHANTQGGYLHSHAHNYPAGSGQQQITLYPHVDENNDWMIVAAPAFDDPTPTLNDDGTPVETPSLEEQYAHKPLEYLKDRTEVRLVHTKTDKKLHSHDTNRPPITEADYQNEVTAYGFPGFGGDANDNWLVEIVSSDSGDRESGQRVRALRTKFRLRHTLTGCYLFSHKIALPDWGFGQQEVTCNKNPTKANSIWFIETNSHPKLDPQAERVNYRRPSFFAKFWELQQVMWETNAGLTERHAYDSRPSSWPLLKRGINFWAKEHRQVYLIGNPFVWWASTGAVLAYFAARGLLMLRAKRGYRDFNDSTVVFYDQTCGFLTLGWAMHYLPFWAMHRQLFLHHYFPALYFSILLSASLFDFATSALRPRFRLQVAGAVIVIAMLVYTRYTPITYAGEWTGGSCESARLLKSWDFDCRNFPESKAEYAHFPPGIHTSPAASARSRVGHDADADTHASVDGGVDVGSGEANTTSSAMDAPIEPGRHAFENAPAKAMSSAHVGGHPPAQPAVQRPGSPNDGSPGGAGAGADDAAAPAAPADQVSAAGLDQEMVEEVILGGTAAAAAGREEEEKGDGSTPSSRA